MTTQAAGAFCAGNPSSQENVGGKSQENVGGDTGGLVGPKESQPVMAEPVPTQPACTVPDSQPFEPEWQDAQTNKSASPPPCTTVPGKIADGDREASPAVSPSAPEDSDVNDVGDSVSVAPPAAGRRDPNYFKPPGFFLGGGEVTQAVFKTLLGWWFQMFYCHYGDYRFLLRESWWTQQTKGFLNMAHLLKQAPKRIIRKNP